MDKLGDLPIDWANVNWPYVIALVLLVFVCTVIGTSLSCLAQRRQRQAVRVVGPVHECRGEQKGRQHSAEKCAHTGSSTRTACPTPACHCGHPREA
jgi:hypothetical protein